jgi:hypothetical protein
VLGRIWNYVSNNPLIAGLLVLLIGSGSVWAWVAPARTWLSTDAHVMRGVLVVLTLLLFTGVAIIVRLVRALRHAPQAERQVHARFIPETFELTPARCRALLVLRHRVDARTTLHDLHERVTHDGTQVDRQTTEAHLQHDMEAAEHAGIVSIERSPGGYGDHYRLTTPDGRDWVLDKQGELQAEAGKGMTAKPRGPRYT